MKRKIPLESYFPGRHNVDLSASRDRLIRQGSYKDLSTIMVVPTRGLIAAKVAWSWMSMMTPMNQKFFRLPPIEKMEVGEAYNVAIEMILSNSELSQWKYLLTVEEDNCPPPDGLLKLYEAMESKTDMGHRPDVVGGLYWTKGECGQPMIYGDPHVMPRNYIPQPPKIDTLQECNGLGMGFNLWRLDMFKKVSKPWFKTVQEYVPGQGVRLGTQDMFFFDNAAKQGYCFACDTRIKVGHWEQSTATMW